MDFQYEIHYRSGIENTVADALSRVQGAEVLPFAVFSIQSNVLDFIKASYQLDPNPASVGATVAREQSSSLQRAGWFT